MVQQKQIMLKSFYEQAYVSSLQKESSTQIAFEIISRVLFSDKKDVILMLDG